MTGSVVSFQGQYFSGGSFRIYLLGNPVVWWSNLAFLAVFLLTYFMAAIKRQRGYDADEDCETKSEWSVGVEGASLRTRLIRVEFPSRWLDFDDF